MFCYQALQLGQADEKLVKPKYLTKYKSTTILIYSRYYIFDLMTDFISTTEFTELQNCMFLTLLIHNIYNVYSYFFSVHLMVRLLLQTISICFKIKF